MAASHGIEGLMGDLGTLAINDESPQTKAPTTDLAREPTSRQDDKLSNTALIVAVREFRPETVLLLIEEGADVNAADEHGTTALIEATRHGRTSNAKLLLQHGADTLLWDRDGLLASNHTTESLRKPGDISVSKKTDRGDGQRYTYGDFYIERWKENLGILQEDLKERLLQTPTEIHNAETGTFFFRKCAATSSIYVCWEQEFPRNPFGNGTVLPPHCGAWLSPGQWSLCSQPDALSVKLRCELPVSVSKQTKTVAWLLQDHGTSPVVTKSGWGHNADQRIGLLPGDSWEQVYCFATNMEFDLPPNRYGWDQGIPGRYAACHAEIQIMAYLAMEYRVLDAQTPGTARETWPVLDILVSNKPCVYCQEFRDKLMHLYGLRITLVDLS